MIDDAKSIAPGSVLQADVCIVGGGAAGVTVALELIASGKSILILESGGRAEEAETQALYAGETADEEMHPPPDKYRYRVFGGSTTIWGGRCIPYDPIDFEQRDYLPESGWPFTRDELAPHYPRANELVEAGRFAYTAEEAYDGASPPMIEGFDSTRVTQDTLERFSMPTNFGATYGGTLAAAGNVRVLLYANCTGIRLAPDGTTVDHLDVATLAGGRFTVKAGRYVLATGGLEVPRLLLTSNDVKPNGIGNEHDHVGRYLQAHIAGTLGTVIVSKPASAVHHGYVMTPDGVYARRRFALTAETQRALRIGNIVARLHFADLPDPAHRSGILSGLYLAKAWIPFEYSKRLDNGERRTIGLLARHAWNVITDPIDTISFVWNWLTRRTFATRKFPSVVIRSKSNRFSLDFHSEQAPNPESRVTLIAERDALNVPKIRIDWRYTPWDVETVRVALRVIKEELEITGCGTLIWNESSLPDEIMRFGAYGGHHIGTARMSADPTRGVVDANCKVHGVDNLHVASCAVMPTSSQANPTLTLVALSVRLGRYLAQQQAAVRHTSAPG